jgi:hypothetical protein
VQIKKDEAFVKDSTPTKSSKANKHTSPHRPNSSQKVIDLEMTWERMKTGFSARKHSPSSQSRKLNEKREFYRERRS